MTDRPQLSVLVVLTSANRRGAEIEGSQLSRQLVALDVDSACVALSGASFGQPLDVEVLGPSPLAPKALRRLRQRARRVDVVVAYGGSTLPACAIALTGLRTPVVYRSIGDPRQWVRNGLHRSRTALLFKRLTHVVALSDSAAQAITELYGVDRSKISVIPNARDPVHFRPATASERTAARASFGLRPEARVVAAVGALTGEKCIGRAIDIVAASDDMTLLVAGDGPERDALITYGQQCLRDRVRFLGSVEDVRSVLWAADALLLTSRTEGMPGIVIEASFCDVPAVATDVGAVREMSLRIATLRVLGDDGNGTAVRELANAVASRTSTAPGHDRMIEFSISTVARQFKELLQSTSLRDLSASGRAGHE